jgi:pyruvate/2-oxoglutarate/acetoin dehydrogenase E1 component
MATSAVVGTTIPLAVGAALANQYQGTADVVVSFFGDGAVEEGVFWESLNFACLKRLRVLFVCEDNDLAIHTPTHQRQGFRSIPKAVAGFQCHVHHCDGSDLMEVIASARHLLRLMEEEQRPALLHCTYVRLLEHVGIREDFDVGYRRRPTPEELERLDPVRRYEALLKASGSPQEELDVIRQQVQEQIDHSVAEARKAPFAPASELTTDVFVDSPEASPASFASFDGCPSSSTRRPRRMSFREAINLALQHEMETDPSVFVFGLDVPDHKRIYGSTAGLVERFGPERCFGTPLSEEAMTGAALGAAMCGLRPVHVHIRVDFMLIAMNQITNMLSNLRYMSGGQLRIPLVIRALIGRGWGQSAQHSKSLHSIFAHVPGLKVVLPSSPQDAYSLLRASIRDDNPVIFLEHRWLYDVEGEVDEAQAIPLGQSMIRKRGDALTVVCTSWMNVEAMKAAEVLSKRGIELELIDVRTAAPLDEAPIIESVRKTQHCIIADYDWVFCGFSAELAALISSRCFDVLKHPVERLGFAHVPCPTTRPLENLFYPSAVTIIRTAERLLDLKEGDLEGEVFYSYEQRFKGPF